MECHDMHTEDIISAGDGAQQMAHFTQSSVSFSSFSTMCMSGLRRVSLQNRSLHVATYRTRPLSEYPS